MTKEDVIKFLEENLKDNDNRVGIKLTTDGDPSSDIGLYGSFTYHYSDDDEVSGYDCEDAEDVVLISEVESGDVVDMVKAMLV